MRFCGFFLTLFLSLPVFAQGLLQNLQTSVSVDMVAPFHFDQSTDNKLDLRSAEMIFYGPLDPTFDAMVNFAAHSEHGEYVAEIHEAYVSSSKLIPSSRFKVGKFLLGVGRLNQFHPHDWVFISAPRVQSEFFAEEPVADTGLEFSTLLPTNSYVDVTVGVTNGYNYGHSHGEGDKPRVPTHYIHPTQFVDFGDTGALLWGLNYLGRTDAEGVQTQLLGADFTFKKTTAKTLDFLLQAEIWYRNLSSPTDDREEAVGAYFYPQWAMTERLFVGLRLDLFREFHLRATDGSTQDNLQYAFVPTMTFKNSEFTFFRVAYTLDTRTMQGESNSVQQMLEFQLVALLGAHPAHSF